PSRAGAPKTGRARRAPVTGARTLPWEQATRHGHESEVGDDEVVPLGSLLRRGHVHRLCNFLFGGFGGGHAAGPGSRTVGMGRMGGDGFHGHHRPTTWPPPKPAPTYGYDPPALSYFHVC